MQSASSVVRSSTRNPHVFRNSALWGCQCSNGSLWWWLSWSVSSHSWQRKSSIFVLLFEQWTKLDTRESNQTSATLALSTRRGHVCVHIQTVEARDDRLRMHG